MAILESVKELASKLGAETNGRDITDQLNKINKHLDETALSGRDIAEAVRTYSENTSGGGGGGETFEVEMTFTVDSGVATTEVISYTSTKKLPEVINAIDSGKKVNFTISLTDGTNSANYPLFGYVKETEGDFTYLSIATYKEGFLLGSPLMILWAADDTTPVMNTTNKFPAIGIMPAT